MLTWIVIAFWFMGLSIYGFYTQKFDETFDFVCSILMCILIIVYGIVFAERERIRSTFNRRGTNYHAIFRLGIPFLIWVFVSLKYFPNSSMWLFLLKI